MIEEITCLLVTIAVLLTSMATRPQHARCPDGFYLASGIRTRPLWNEPTGRFSCERPPIGGDDDVLTGKSTARSRPGTIYGELYCTNSQTPVVVNQMMVSCQARH